MSIRKWLVAMLVGVVTVPMGLALVLLREGCLTELEWFLALGFMASIVLAWPVAALVAHVLVVRDMREMNAFCLRARNGEYGEMWTLPPEREDEPETVRLRRNLYWLVRVAARREECLATRLDVEARSSLENERLARMDPLTGVFNRRHFDEYLVGCLGCPVAGRVCLLFIDCDDFKAVNDGHGHESGDEVLRRLGDLLSGAVRDGADCAFRYGGDEFAVVLRGRDREDARIVAERVRARFEREGLYGTTLSIGVAECACGCAGGDVARRLVGDADAAVYEAKRRGRNRVVAAWDLRLDAEAREVVTEAS